MTLQASQPSQDSSNLSPQAQAFKTANPEKYAEMLELYEEETLSQLLAMSAEDQLKMLAPTMFHPLEG